ncbi:uncharacterized protein B0H18DRAFT_1045626 [Fomitopsis serialis]|uniref:uncharacterized protein n=1 Tax=Fomitopsis serialis TaxID=139415 RepID=UPI002008DD1F|nr:uncharacterized protein B0H18DRAFT_1045626 [Neoantrodia serialis]KAH9914433.1 hypothetical protein B0H18DRAFT_1045626 [Neoantrodia serialis]
MKRVTYLAMLTQRTRIPGRPMMTVLTSTMRRYAASLSMRHEISNASRSAAGPVNERPKRNRRPVKRYGQHRAPTQTQEIPKTEEGKEEEENSTYQKLKGKAKAFARTVSKPRPKPEARGHGKVSGQKDKGKGKDTGKSQAKRQPALQALLLALPPLMHSEDERDEVVATGGPNTDNSDATTSGAEQEAASTSADASRVAGPSGRQNVDSDNEEEEDAPVPPDEHEWSQFYHWDHPDGIEERSRMLDAIQRQNPDITFRFPT